MKTAEAIIWVALAAAVALLSLQLHTASTPQVAQLELLTNRINALSQQQPLVRERVIELPEDGRAFHVTLLYPREKETQAGSRELAAQLASTPRLQSLLAQCKVHEHRPGQWVYEERYAGVPLPSLIFVDPDGALIYKASGLNLPADGEALADEIQANLDLYAELKLIGQCGPDGCRPSTPATPPRVFDRIPDLRGPAQEGASEWLPLALAVAAGLGGLWLARRRK
jgi:hypothetical protein